MVSKIEGSGLSFVPKMGCVKREVKPVSFKLGVCLYILALGASAKTAGDCASLGRSTVELWLSQFTEVCTKVLKPQYMPAKPLEPSLLAQVRSEFSARRGIPNAATGVIRTCVHGLPSALRGTLTGILAKKRPRGMRPEFA